MKGHYWYALTPEMCNWRCAFEADTDEIKVQSETFTAVYPKGYEDLATFSVASLKQCYTNNIKFLGYDSNKPRIGIKAMLSSQPSAFTGFDEYISGVDPKWRFDADTNNLNWLISEKEDKRCPSYLRSGHELTHILAQEMLGKNKGLNEGLAEFVEFQNGYDVQYTCLDTSWRYFDENSNNNKNYVNISTNPSDGGPSIWHYYATGYCFWTDLVEEYGYPSFVEIMQKLYTKSRGVDNYYVFDVIEEVIGGPLSEDIVNRYSLTKESTRVEICDGCEMFVT